MKTAALARILATLLNRIATASAQAARRLSPKPARRQRRPDTRWEDQS